MAQATDISLIQQYTEQFKKELLAVALLGAEELKQHFTLISGVKDKYTVHSLQFQKLLKPYAKAWSPVNNKAQLIPRTLRVELAQVELEEEPLSYRKTYLGAMLQKGVNPLDHPFERYFLDGIMKKIADDICLEVAFNGVRDANGTDPVDVVDGLYKIIDDAIAANQITIAKGNLITTGTIDSTNAVDKLKAFYRAIPKAYQRVMTKLYVPYEVAEAYNDHYQAINGALPYNTEFEKVYLEGSNGKCEIVKMAGMTDSNRIFCTQQENVLYGVDLESDEERVEIVNIGNPKTVGFFTCFALGFQIAVVESFFTNESVAGSGSAS
jgi:hypothetical protein